MLIFIPKLHFPALNLLHLHKVIFLSVSAREEFSYQLKEWNLMILPEKFVPKIILWKKITTRNFGQTMSPNRSERFMLIYNFDDCNQNIRSTWYILNTYFHISAVTGKCSDRNFAFLKSPMAILIFDEKPSSNFKKFNRQEEGKLSQIPFVNLNDLFWFISTIMTKQRSATIKHMRDFHGQSLCEILLLLSVMLMTQMLLIQLPK